MGMTFKREKGRNKALIKDLRQGDTFLYNDEVYMVIEQSAYGNLGFINLNLARKIDSMPQNATVPLINSELRYTICC